MGVENSHFEAKKVWQIDEDDLAILFCICKLAGKKLSAGRYSLAKDTTIVARGITESKLQKRLRRLQEAGMISVGKTRQGVTITEKGRQKLEETV